MSMFLYWQQQLQV